MAIQAKRFEFLDKETNLGINDFIGKTSLGLETVVTISLGVIFVSVEVNLDLETGVVLAGFKANGFLTSGLGVVLAVVFLFPQYFQN